MEFFCCCYEKGSVEANVCMKEEKTEEDEKISSLCKKVMVKEEGKGENKLGWIKGKILKGKIEKEILV